jgi:sigma-B regulation protein RsbU (phosphoserine phosphatase)
LPEPQAAAADPRHAGLLDDSAEDLYEHAPCGYLSTRLDGTFAKVNQTFLTWTGYDRQELLGHRRFQDLLPAGNRIFHETHYRPLLQMQGAVNGVAAEIVCADGRRLPVLLNSALKRDDDGEPVFVRTTVFDATDRREYERELLRARRRAEESERRVRSLAQTLQTSFIPPDPPRFAGYDIAGVYRPAGQGDEVGGDFYEVFGTGRQDWALAVGDVCGKGAGAAVVTAVARHTISAATMRTRRPRLVLAALNQALLGRHGERFCTVTYARFRESRGRCRLVTCSAGHPLPVRLSGGRASSVGRPGSLLGVFAEPGLHDVVVDLAPGDAVVFYTDGVTEGRRGRELYGEERLKALLEACPATDAAGLARAIADDVLGFQEGLPRDDIAIVVVRVAPEAGPDPDEED